MKIRNGIDLGESFKQLVNGFKEADKYMKNGNNFPAHAYPLLAGFVEAHISQCTEEDKKEGETQDDIPEQLFRQ